MESIQVRSADGVLLFATHVTAGPRSDLAVVLAHGFTVSTRKELLRRVATRLARGSGVLAFDFRGHGRSGGRTTAGDLEVLDLDAVVGLARSLGYRRVATVGFSMGGAVAVRHAAGASASGGYVPARPVDAVVSVSAPSRWYVRDTVPMRRVHWLLTTRTGRLVAGTVLRTRVGSGWPTEPEPPVRVAGRIAPTPFLVVHGDADPFFGIEHGRALAAAGAAELWEEPGFGHAEGALTPALVDRIAGWVRSATGPAGTMRR
jgi:pimeloyl-ACP methyl ester carboxylesterase